MSPRKMAESQGVRGPAGKMVIREAISATPDPQKERWKIAAPSSALNRRPGYTGYLPTSLQYLPMKPTGAATPFLAWVLMLFTKRRWIWGF